MSTKSESDNPLPGLMRTGRKYGATTYTYSANTIKSTDSDDGKVVVTVRNNKTNELLMAEKLSLNDVIKNGLPLPGGNEIIDDVATDE